MINYTNVVVPTESMWKIVAAGDRSTNSTVVETVRETVVQRESERRVVWHWFEINGNRTTNRLRAKLHEAQLTLFGEHRLSALVAITAEISATADGSRELLTRFLQTYEPALIQCLDHQVDTDRTNCLSALEQPR